MAARRIKSMMEKHVGIGFRYLYYNLCYKDLFVDLNEHNMYSLGYPKEYKSICEKGLMRFASIGQPTPRILSWYLMTDEGVKVFAALKNAGLKFPKHYNNYNNFDLTDNGQQIFNKVINQMFK